MTDATPIRDPKIRLRAEWADSLAFCISQCHPDDAVAVMVAALEQVATPPPQHDVFGTLYADAGMWAAAAHPHEVRAYVIAGLAALPSDKITRKARREALTALWRGMHPQDQAAFLKAIGARHG